MQHTAILRKLPAMALVSALAIGSASAAEVSLKSSIDKAGYGAAYQFAKGMMQSNIKPSAEAIMLGVQDGIANKKLRVSDAEMQAAFEQVRKDIQAEVDKQSQENAKNGKAFLEKNKKAKGVVTTKSGLQYKIIKAAAKNAVKPKATDTVKVHYTGTLIDGTEFDSSVKRGTAAQFPVNGVIKGWTEALQLMGKGAKWQLFIPAELAYGERGAGSVEPNSTLIFDVELLDVITASK